MNLISLSAMKKSVLPAVALLSLLSCGRKPSKEPTGPLVDSAGSRFESRRSDLQFLAVSGQSDSVDNTRSGSDLREAVRGSLERDARAYRDSLRTEGNSAVWGSGWVDWRETWLSGQVDRPALALALVRSLVDTSASLVEWSLSDSLRDTLALGVVYQLPGPYGGAIDSVKLHVGRGGVGRSGR